MNRPVWGLGSAWENGFLAWNLSPCQNSNPLPCQSLVPDLVCTDTMPAVAWPNSAS